MSDEHQLILQAALDEFAELGVSDQSLERVAARCGLDPRAVRALYIDEKALLQAVLEDLTNPLVSAITVAVQDIDNPQDLVRRSFEMLDAWLLDHPRYVRLSLQCMVASPEVLQVLFRSSLYPSEFVERFERFVAEGSIKQQDVVMVMVFFDSLMFFPHLAGSFLAPDGQPALPEEFLTRRTQAVMDLFDSGLFAAGR